MSGSARIEHRISCHPILQYTNTSWMSFVPWLAWVPMIWNRMCGRKIREHCCSLRYDQFSMLKDRKFSQWINLSELRRPVLTFVDECLHKLHIYCILPASVWFVMQFLCMTANGFTIQNHSSRPYNAFVPSSGDVLAMSWVCRYLHLIDSHLDCSTHLSLTTSSIP